MAKLILTGFDPSLRNWGMAKGEYDTETKQLTLIDIGLKSPEANTSRTVRQSSKDVSKAIELFNAAFEFHKAKNLSDMVFIEVPHGSQSSRSSMSAGICIGIIGALQALKTPLIQVSANEVKLASVGRKTASKTDMITWATNTHPEVPWPTHIKNGQTLITTGIAEHISDAVAAIYAGINTVEFQNLVALYKSQQQNKEVS